ncbi:MAG: LemA family protein [Gammaproteobacteria bacterium]|nr:LemA family protein [Gammaproteobacteria bacterium]MDH4313627.1 LemA family protein [Gammaproteobacteria bacterium]
MFILLLTIALIAVLVAILYNRLVRDRNRTSAAWSDIDVQLQRRHDLVPQLVKAVEQYAAYERATIEAVTTLRKQAMHSSSIAELGKTEEELGSGIKRLLAIAEAYPDLKANENFLQLQKELVETEDYLQFARRYYNGSVRELNTRIETVPNNMIASLFGFKQKDYFQKSSDDAANVPLVKLGSIE